MELVVELQEQHVSISHLAKPVIRDIFQHVETLYLLSRYHQVYFNSQGQLEQARAAVTRGSPPILQSLTIEHGEWALRRVDYHAVQSPAATKVPTFTHLAVRKAPMDKFCGIPAFVERYGPRLASLELHCCDDGILGTTSSTLYVKHLQDCSLSSTKMITTGPPSGMFAYCFVAMSDYLKA